MKHVTTRATRVDQPIQAATEGQPAARPSGAPAADLAFEIIGDSTADGVDIATLFAQVAARMGDHVWMDYMADGGNVCRVRIGRGPVYSGGDRASFALVFDSELLPVRLAVDAFHPGSYCLIDDPFCCQPGSGECSACSRCGDLIVQAVPLRSLASRVAGFPRGDRLVALGLLTSIFGYDPALVRRLLENKLAARGRRVVSAALRLFELGWRDAGAYVPDGCRRRAQGLRARVAAATAAATATTAATAVATAPLAASTSPANGTPDAVSEWAPAAAARSYSTAPAAYSTAQPTPVPASAGRAVEVMSGAEALAFGALTAGFTGCVSLSEHPVAERWVRVFASLGGRVLTSRQAELYCGAAGRVLHVEVAGAPASPGGWWPAHPGCGMPATEGGARHEPRVTLRIERTPTANETPFPFDADPLAAATGCWGTDRPVVLAPTTVEECYHFMGLARRLAQGHRRDCVVLLDAALLDAVQGWRREGEAARHVLADWLEDAVTEVPLPGQPAAAGAVNELLTGLGLASAPLSACVRAPQPVGGETGDVLLVGWGMTRGPIEEAVVRLRAKGLAISALHLRTLSPWSPDLGRRLAAFRRVVLVDVADDRHAAMRRTRHVGNLLRAAVSTAVPPSAAPVLTARVFPRPELLRPAAVEGWAAALTATAHHPDSILAALR